MMEIEKLPAALFSPAKMVYIAYVLAIYFDKLTTTKWEFLLISLLFFAAEIWHNDYYRIRLNRKAGG